MKFQLLLEELLTELTGEEIYTKYYKDMPSQLFGLVVSNDPQTIVKDGQIVKIGKYAKLLLAMFKAGNLKKEDLPRAKEYLTYVYKYGIPLDATKILELSDIYDLIKKYMAQNSTNISDIASHLQSNEYNKVYEDNQWVIYVPFSERAACYLGVNSQWCTTWGPYSLSDDNKTKTSYFNRYNKDGYLYIIINKADQQEKYQFHFESSQYMNVADRQIKITDFMDQHPKIKAFFFPSLVRKVSKEEMDGELTRIGILQPGEAMTILRQSITGKDNNNNQLVISILSGDNDEINKAITGSDIVEEIGYEEGYITIPLENLPTKAEYVEDALSSYRYELNSSDSNLRNDIQEANVDESIEKVFADYYTENYDELRESLGILDYNSFSESFWETFIGNEDTRTEFIGEMATLSEPAYEEAYQEEIDKIEKYIKFSKYSRTKEVSLNTVFMVQFIIKQNTQSISDKTIDIYSFVDSYIDHYNVNQDFEGIYNYDWKYPDYKNGGDFAEYIDDYFEKLIDKNEVTKECIERRKLFNTIYHRLFKDNKTFENEHVIVRLNSLTVNCDNGSVDIYYKNKDTNQEHSGYVKVENLSSYVTNYELFEHVKKRFNRIIL
jgi:hypothetical protein